jgi:hypothetical protein
VDPRRPAYRRCSVRRLKGRDAHGGPDCKISANLPSDARSLWDMPISLAARELKELGRCGAGFEYQ